MTFIEAVAGEEIRAGQLVYREAGGRVFAARATKYPVRHMDRRGRVWTKQRRGSLAGLAARDTAKGQTVDLAGFARVTVYNGRGWVDLLPPFTP